MTIDDVEKADRLSRLRARMLPALAAIFLVQQGAFVMARIEGGTRTVDRVTIGAWLVLSVVLLLLLTTGGAWLQRRSVRTLLNDEVTRANRTSGMELGFIAAMFGAVALYLFTLFEPLSGPDAIHVLMTVGIGAALLRYGYLERRAHRDG
jgi:hypothetical protein